MVKYIVYVFACFILFNVFNVSISDDKLRDPTTPLLSQYSNIKNNKSSDNEVNSLQLQAILTVGLHKKAIINSKSCYLGQECFGYNLIEIGTKKVVLKDKDSGNKLTLSLYSSRIKK